MRKKIEDKDKNIKFGITIHPELSKLLAEKSKELNITKSRMIQNIMKEYFKNKTNMND